MSRATLLLAALLTAGPISGQEMSDPVQTLNLRIGQCHLAPEDVGLFDGGDPEVRIVYYQAGKAHTWSTLQTAPNARGYNYTFNITTTIAFDMGTSVHIQLVDRDVIRNDIVFDRECRDESLRASLGDGRLHGGKSWVDIKIADPEGAYEVRLCRTFIATNDFLALGGTLEREQRLPTLNWLTEPVVSLKIAMENTKVMIGNSYEKADHLVLIRQNEKIVFDSSKNAKGYPQGLFALWTNASFTLNWKHGDYLKVEFYDHNTLLPNKLILEAASNHDNSIALLQQPIHGGLTRQSGVCLTTRFVK